MSYEIRIDTIKDLVDQEEITEREAQMLELAFLDGLKNREIAKFLGLSERQVYKCWTQLDIKFPGFKERMEDLFGHRAANVNTGRTYRQADLPRLKDENGDMVAQDLGNDYVYINGKWEKVIRRF